jgi:hypothetical protein
MITLCVCGRNGPYKLYYANTNIIRTECFDPRQFSGRGGVCIYPVSCMWSVNSAAVTLCWICIPEFCGLNLGPVKFTPEHGGIISLNMSQLSPSKTLSTHNSLSYSHFRATGPYCELVWTTTGCIPRLYFFKIRFNITLSCKHKSLKWSFPIILLT